MPQSRARKAPTRNDRRRAELDRRRHAASIAARAERRRRRRTILVAGGALVLVAGAVATTLIVRDDGAGADTELTGTRLDESGDPLTVTGPDAYRVVYRSDAYDGDDVSTTSLGFTVRRPFDASVESRDGAPPGGDLQWEVVSNLGLYADASGGASQVSHALPQPALGDLRLDATLADLVDQGLFLPRERRELLGRECQVYRTGAALETFSTAFPTDTDYTDACVDASGLLLEQVSVSEGEVTGRMTAVEIETDEVPADDLFTIEGEPVALADGGIELEALADAALPAGSWEFPELPAGFEHQGRYAFRQPAATDETATDTTETTAAAVPAPIESYVDVYVDGTTVLVVLQGPAAGEPSTNPTGAQTLDLADLGSAEASVGLTGSTILAHPSADWFVQIAGTVPLATLQGLAETLVAS